MKKYGGPGIKRQPCKLRPKCHERGQMILGKPGQQPGDQSGGAGLIGEGVQSGGDCVVVDQLEKVDLEEIDCNIHIPMFCVILSINL